MTCPWVAVGQMVDASPKPKRRRRSRVSRGNTVLLILDRYLVWFSSGIAATVFLVASWMDHPLSQGAQAALGSFVAYAALKGKTDNRWRELEIEREELQALVEALDETAPGSPAALAARKELVALARRAQAGDEEGS